MRSHYRLTPYNDREDVTPWLAKVVEVRDLRKGDVVEGRTVLVAPYPSEDEEQRWIVHLEGGDHAFYPPGTLVVLDP